MCALVDGGTLLSAVQSLKIKFYCANAYPQPERIELGNLVFLYAFKRAVTCIAILVTQG